jgi:hypothetical protein
MHLILHPRATMPEISLADRRQFLRVGILGAALFAGGCNSGDEPTQVTETKPGGNRRRLDGLKEKTDNIKPKKK